MDKKFITTEDKKKIQKLDNITSILVFFFIIILNALPHIVFNKKFIILLVIMTYILSYINYKIELKQFIVITERVKKWTISYFIVTLIFFNSIIAINLFFEKEKTIQLYLLIFIIVIYVILEIVYNKVFKNNEYNNLKINL